MKNKILEVKNLSKIYHDTNNSVLAVNDISFDVFDGEILAIVGPSGAGKSTILSILSGIDSKSSGEIIYNKDNILLSYMLQKDSLFPWLTILDNCLIGLKINKTLNKKNKEHVIDLLKTYGLYEFMGKFPDSLSGGMRQRTSLIRTLAVNPDILLLDEATSALDYQTGLYISEDIYNIVKNEKKTAIIVTHDIGLAISLADRVIVLSKRPAEVKNIYNIELDNKSTPIKNRGDTKFNFYFQKIWSDLNDE